MFFFDDQLGSRQIRRINVKYLIPEEVDHMMDLVREEIKADKLLADADPSFAKELGIIPVDSVTTGELQDSLPEERCDLYLS